MACPAQRRATRWQLTIALVAGLICINVSGSVHHDQLPSQHATPLPDGPEKALIMQYCSACHGVERVQHSGGSAAIWADRIRRMIRWGAAVPPQQIPMLADYLAKALPRRLRPPPTQTFFANIAVRAAALQSIHTTLRAAARFDAAERRFVVSLQPDEVMLLKIGQRARIFSLQARSSMMQAKIAKIIKHDGHYLALADAGASSSDLNTPCIIEIVIERGKFLAIPNEALIEDGERRFVYVQDDAGEYLQRDVTVGLQGDLFTQVQAGLTAGEQVVTLGGFFIDAEYKMNPDT